MFKVVNNNIYITRGDSAILNLAITDNTGAAFTIPDDAEVLLTVKKDTATKDYLLQKRIITGQVNIKPADTESLSYGNYYYDVQVKLATGYTDTVIAPHAFIVCEEVTF